LGMGCRVKLPVIARFSLCFASPHFRPMPKGKRPIVSADRAGPTQHSGLIELAR